MDVTWILPTGPRVIAHRAPDPVPDEEPIPEPHPIPDEDPVPDHNPSAHCLFLTAMAKAPWPPSPPAPLPLAGEGGEMSHCVTFTLKAARTT
jgi:hypothetical protein